MIWMIFSIITILISSLIRIRILRQIFERSDRYEIITTTIVSIISVCLFSLLYYVKQTVIINEYTYSIIYAVIIVVASILYYTSSRSRGWIIQSIVWLSLTMLWWPLWLYSMRALWEESLKRTYIKKFTTWLLWKIILLSIVSGIVFWRTENLVYIIQYIVQDIPNHKILSLIQHRGIIPVIVHIGSLCITIILWFELKKYISNIRARSIGLVAWIGSHYLFNIYQVYQVNMLSWVSIIVYIIIITYSLFRSDILYTKNISTQT
jgi:hypothetical protein